MSVQQQFHKIEQPVVTNSWLKQNVTSAHERGASDGEVSALIQEYTPGGGLYDVPPEKRPEFLTALKQTGCPEDVFPIVQRLVQVANGYGGKFVICGFGEVPSTGDALSPQISHVQNEGEPIFLYRQFGSAIRELGKTPHLNIYIMPALVRADLPKSSRGKESDVIGVLAVVLDFDDKHDPVTRLNRLPAEPHAEVETSSGNFHCWYFLDKPYSVTEVKPIIAGLVAKAGSDIGCKSADHPFRLPGTLNWPNANKRARGRSAKPVLAKLADSDIIWPSITLDSLKAAILAKWPDAFDMQQVATVTATEFDWDQRCNSLEPLSELKIKEALNKRKHSNDRSAGAWAFIQKARSSGHSPNEIVQMILDHPDAIHVGHYGNPPAADRVRADVQRAFLKNTSSHLTEALTFDIFGGEAVEIDPTNADAWLAEMNRHFAVVKYGGQIVVAQFSDNKLEFMEVKHFHNMLANKFINVDGDTKPIPISKSWFAWKGRREYLNPGVVFEPGAPDEPGKKLNLWRGFGVTPKLGNWSRMEAHIRECICSDNKEHFEYLIKWMAYGVQHPDQQIGVAVALRGAQGAGKGILCRTYGSFFGQHFVHLSQGSQLTGRFNASLGTACAAFLDEALWAGDRQGEGTLKALITEPTFQLERKFRDPITVPNRLRIMIASNSDWFVPVGTGDRRFFVLDVADTYAGIGHQDYWNALHNELDNGGREAMLHDLLAMDLGNFDVRSVPSTAAKTEQKFHSLRGTRAWLAHFLQEGAIGAHHWKDDGLEIDKEAAYQNYVSFSKDRHEWQPEEKSFWAKTLYKALDGCLDDGRPHRKGAPRPRMLKFGLLNSCRTAFDKYIGTYGDETIWEQVD